MSDSTPEREWLSRLFFPLAAIFSALCVLSRFDEVLVRTPYTVQLLALVLHGPILFGAGLLDARARRENDDTEIPRMPRDAKWAFTFGFTYLAIVTLQVLNFELGPIDPTPPDSFPLAQRIGWYLMFSFGMSFVNYLAAVQILLPVLRAFAWPVRDLHVIIGLLIMLLVGGCVSIGLYMLFEQAAVQRTIAQFSLSLEEPKWIWLSALSPLLLSWALSRNSKHD